MKVMFWVTYLIKKFCYVILLIAFPMYLTAMFLIPTIQSYSSSPSVPEAWIQLQKIWYSWQSLNVGMLALISSLIFYRGTQKQSKDKAEREFKAAIAELPVSLSRINLWCRSCSSYLKLCWEKLEGEEKFPNEIPALNQEVFSQLKDVIRFGNEKEQQVLSYFFQEYQISTARLESLRAVRNDNAKGSIDRYSIRSQMICIAGILLICDRLFPYSRNSVQTIDVKNFTKREVISALVQMKIIHGSDDDSFESIVTFAENLLTKRSPIYSRKEES